MPEEVVLPTVIVDGVVASKAVHAQVWIEAFVREHAERPAYKNVRAGVLERYRLRLRDADIVKAFRAAGK